MPKVDVKRAVELRKAEWTLEKIAEEFNCTASYVGQVTKKHMPPKRRVDKVLTREMYSNGMSITAIAREMRCSTSRVQEIVHAASPDVERKKVDVELAREMRAKKMTLIEIARYFGCSSGHIHRITKPPTTPPSKQNERAREMLPTIKALRAALPSKTGITAAEVALTVAAAPDGVLQRDLCVDIGGDPNSSSIATIIKSLEAAGFVERVSAGESGAGNRAKIVRWSGTSGH